jgi:hypothetical protein
MNNLKQLLNELADVTATAAIDVEAADPRTRSGLEGMVNNAKLEIDRIKAAYKTRVLENAIVISVSGESSEEFARVAREKLGIANLDYRSVNNRIVESIKNRRAGDVLESAALGVVSDEIGLIGRENGFTAGAITNSSYQDGIYGQPIALGVDNLIRLNYGTALNSVIVAKQIGELAFDLRFSEGKFPVIVYNSGAFDIGLMPSPVHEVSSVDPNENNVMQEMQRIKDSLMGAEGKRPKATTNKNRKVQGDNANE